MRNNKAEKYPKILVISNNAFSETSNNGKTLASFFKEFPKERVAQLYFNNEFPDDNDYYNYYRITDKEMLKSKVSNQGPGRTVQVPQKNKNINKVSGKSLLIKFKKSNISRILRELLWMNSRWETDSLDQWLNQFSPEIVFLCAGDSGFAYDISNKIKSKFDAKLIVYITDDYILPRKSISLFWWIRRNYIFTKMKHTVQQSDLFITISKEMRNTYKELFKVDSFLAMNMTTSLHRKDIIKSGNKNKIILIYAGGLHFNRYKTLHLLSKAIHEFNQKSYGRKAFLKIYSGAKPDEKIKKYLNIEDASEFYGYLNGEDLIKELNSCDIPVHVEAFDSKSIESTKLSISTKIPEYLSLKKPVLAIGPSRVASMNYLKESAYCITEIKQISTKLQEFLNNDELKLELAKKAAEQYDENHNSETALQKLLQLINSINSPNNI